MATIGTYNEEGVNIDLYIPRKCHATNTLISSYDHASVQLTIANVGSNGVIDGTATTLCIAGYLRGQGNADHAINHLCVSRGIIRIKTGKPPKARAPKRKNAAAAPAKGQKGAKPQGQKGAKPQGTKGAKPQGQKGQAPRRK